MTAALYDVKAHLSEYITYAENGELVEITKHGVVTTVLISLKMYEEMKADYERRNRPSFMEAIQKWRNENFEYLDDEYADTVERLVQEDKKIIDERGNPWN